MCREEGWIDVGPVLPMPRRPGIPRPVLALPAGDDDDDEHHTSPHHRHHHRLRFRGNHDAKTKMCGRRDAWPSRAAVRGRSDSTRRWPAGGRASTREALAEQLSDWSWFLVRRVVSWSFFVVVRLSRCLFLGADRVAPRRQGTRRPPAPPVFVSFCVLDNPTPAKHHTPFPMRSFPDLPFPHAPRTHRPAPSPPRAPQPLTSPTNGRCVLLTQ
ncbi:hypothetical protein B0H17DRAFT_299772 [Mycena rosella]|uniref:Uncharacterized protein n=1 Tax=Mycena rosella TaxID=1033263 RepID=A0AAD7CVC2_MYCRO|nr:hypothetical protein B0H17DRAFT_299772 [Mycena rosella]